MKKYLAVAVVAVVLGLLIIPVLIAQFTKVEPRKFQGVKLEDASYREIEFHNSAQDIGLAGLLFVPEGDGPFPAVVMIHGSGTSHRDSRWYLTISQYLQENGIVVLLPDKRGSERSEGDWHSASFDDLATDTLAAISLLRDQKSVAISHIGVVGMSQGGHIAPVVADESTEVAFLVNVVGAAVPMHEQLLYEENYNLREMGVPPGFSNLIAYPSSWMIRNVAQREFWDAIGNFDPIPYWERLSIDSLVLYGEQDTNVPSRESAAILRSLGKANITVTIYDGSGHALEDPEGMGNSIFREDALRDIADFITSVGSPNS